MTGSGQVEEEGEPVQRCKELLRRVPAFSPEDGSPALEIVSPEFWSYRAPGEPAAASPPPPQPDPKAKAKAAPAPAEPPPPSLDQLEAQPDPQRGGLFLSHVWDEPEGWSSLFGSQPYIAAKQIQVATGLRAAVARGLSGGDAAPKVWVDYSSLPAQVTPEDHPAEQMQWGPYQIHVKELKSFAPKLATATDGYTILNFPEGRSFEGVMNLREFDAAGRPSSHSTPREVKWDIPPGWYHVRSARVISEDTLSPAEAEAKPPFRSRVEQLRKWCFGLGLRDEVWVEFTLGSFRAECLLLADTMLTMHSGLVAVVPWNYFDRLWPLWEWAVFSAINGPGRVQLAVDTFSGPALVEYHRAIRRVDVSAAVVRDPRDRDMLLLALEKLFKCKAHRETLGYEKPCAHLPMAPAQERQVDYAPVERFVRSTAIAAFAREAALQGLGRLGEDDQGGWTALAEELGYQELHSALKECKPFDWSRVAHGQSRGEEAEAWGPSSVLTDAAESIYLTFLEDWWEKQVLPALETERRRALR